MLRTWSVWTFPQFAMLVSAYGAESVVHWMMRIAPIECWNRN